MPREQVEAKAISKKKSTMTNYVHVRVLQIRLLSLGEKPKKHTLKVEEKQSWMEGKKKE